MSIPRTMPAHITANSMFCLESGGIMKSTIKPKTFAVVMLLCVFAYEFCNIAIIISPEATNIG